MFLEQKARRPIDMGGFEYLAKKVLVPGLLGEVETFQSLIRDLLTDRESRELTTAREKGLCLLNNWALALAKFGSGSQDGLGQEVIPLNHGFSEVHLPPVNARRLVELGVIVNEQTVQQIKAREERKGAPAENRVIIKALTPAEIEAVQQLAAGKSGVIGIEEHYTVASTPLNREFHGIKEVDIVRQFILGLNGQGQTNLFLIGELHFPHIHFSDGNEWFRLDSDTQPAWLPDNKTEANLPIIDESRFLLPATNDDIATLLALVRYSVD